MRIRDWSSDVCSSDLPSQEAHKLIEEMMIQANVCAAETLEAKRSPLIYRIHDTPSPEKVQALADFLQTLGIAWSKGEAPRTDRFNKLLGETREGPNADIVNEVVLRSQMQAIYSTENIGHRSEEQTSELKSLMRTSYAVFCLKKK